MISRKTIQTWRKIRKRHPELAEVEEPLKWLITEFDRLHRSGMTKDRIRVTLIGMIAERGLAPQFDAFRAKVEEIERAESGKAA